MTDWIRLRDVIAIERGATYKSNLVGQPGPVLLGLASIERNGGFRRDSLRTYGGESPTRMLVTPGQVYASLKDVTQSADLLGSVARLPADSLAGRLTQDTVRLDLISDVVTVDYVYWCLRTPQYRAYCRAHATGTTNLGLPRDDFLNFEIPTPTPWRITLVKAIGALDDLIETNRRLQEALAHQRSTTMARAVSSASASTTVGEIAQLVRVQVLPTDVASGTAYLGLEHFAQRAGGLLDVGVADGLDSLKWQFEPGDILYGKLRPYFRKVARPRFGGVCSTEVWVLRPREGISSEYLEWVVSTQKFTDFAMAGSGGTRMPRANWEHVCTFAVGKPAGDDFVRAVTASRVMWEQYWALHDENEELAHTRDELLPLLLSGRLQTGDVAA